MSERPQAVGTVRIDEPRVRVTEYRFAPGAETGWHRHGADYVVVPLLDGDLLLEEPGGGTRIARLAAHVPYARREGVEHNVVNANAFDFAFLEIELLDGAGGHAHGEAGPALAMMEAFSAAWNRHDLATIMALSTDDCEFWSAAGPEACGTRSVGREAVAAAYQAIFDLYPDGRWTNGRATLIAPDRGLSEWIFVGTTTAGQRVEVMGLDLLELKDGRVRVKNSFRKTRTG
jgi:beta-alanine degradation protein BauB